MEPLPKYQLPVKPPTPGSAHRTIDVYCPDGPIRIFRESRMTVKDEFKWFKNNSASDIIPTLAGIPLSFD
ncbi:hypothetical protein IE4872_PD01691 (plasmid) [Rhizobium gallicum]|uniref:Uncharacterized protein n=1 Tax=Rhizobium gallicum TaxID=56730 RepID=A0A1L5NWC7_9HYPH|nr:hypothetical protein IE4872_PD01691 [Rhizobium gallicum]